jgi:plasmid segregation protein ParM
MQIIGLDVGYSNLKICAGRTDGPPMKVMVYPVGAGPQRLLAENIRGGLSDAISVLVDGQPYVACVEPERLANWQRALHDNYAASPSYRALFHAALLQNGEAHIDRLVTGLPVSHFLDKRRKAELVAQMTGIHEIAPGKAVRVAEVSVIPQPVGAYLDAAVSSGREKEFADAEVLIIDPGFFSVDWVLVFGNDVQYEWSGSSTLATSRLLEEVGRIIYREHECRIPVEKLERAVRAGKDTIRAFKQQVPLSPILAEAAAEVAPMVLNSVKASMRSKAADISTVVLAGGGAHYYRQAIEDIFPKAEILVPENPVVANARGFWYYGAM